MSSKIDTSLSSNCRTACRKNTSNSLVSILTLETRYPCRLLIQQRIPHLTDVRNFQALQAAFRSHLPDFAISQEFTIVKELYSQTLSCDS